MTGTGLILRGSGIGLLAALLVLSDWVYSQPPPVLEVWTPGRSRSHYRDKMTVPFLEKLQEVTGRKVRVNSSSDPDELFQACAEYQADHVLVNHIEGEVFMERFGYKLLAFGDASTALYTLTSQDKPLDKLATVGFLRRTGMDEAIVRELQIEGFEQRLVVFPSDSSGIKALFAKKVEGLIISRHLIKQLTPALSDQLVLRYPLKTPGRVMVLASPKLAPEISERLQQLYLSDDPVIRDLFLRRAGLTVHPPEELEGALDTGAQLSAQ